MSKLRICYKYAKQVEVRKLKWLNCKSVTLETNQPVLSFLKSLKARCLYYLQPLTHVGKDQGPHTQRKITSAGITWPCINFSVHVSTLSQVQHVNSMLILIIISDKAKPTIMGHETLAVSKIASACEESARTRQFVQLQWEPEHIPPN